MKIPSKKICDLCGITVAKKHEILYHTVKPFVTIRMDEPVSYANMEGNTTKSNFHFCDSCFYEISVQAEKALKERDQNAR